MEHCETHFQGQIPKPDTKKKTTSQLTGKDPDAGKD